MEHLAAPVGARQQVVEQPRHLRDMHARERHQPLRRGGGLRLRLGEQGRREDRVQALDHLLELGAPLAAWIRQRVRQLLADVPGVRPEDDDPAREEHRFLDAVGDHDERVHARGGIAPQVHHLAA